MESPFWFWFRLLLLMLLRTGHAPLGTDDVSAPAITPSPNHMDLLILELLPEHPCRWHPARDWADHLV